VRLTCLRTPETQVESPLLCLLAELRLQIYSYVLSEGSITICDGYSCGPGRVPYRDKDHIHYPRHLLHLLHLLEVCQQIYTDAKALVFKINRIIGRHFVVGRCVVDGRFTEEQMSAMTSIWLDIPVRHLHYQAKLIDILYQSIKPLKNLQKVQNISLCWYSCCRSDGQALVPCRYEAWADSMEDLVKNVTEDFSQSGRNVDIRVIKREI
jgi:hypothetical protein